jgi:adenylosuccinate lyase
MRENIERGLGLHASSRVLLVLVEQGGLSREDAYAIVQRCAMQAADMRVPLRGQLDADPAVAAHVPAGALDACFDDSIVLRHVDEVIARLDPIEAAAHARRADAGLLASSHGHSHGHSHPHGEGSAHGAH